MIGRKGFLVCTAAFAVALLVSGCSAWPGQLRPIDGKGRFRGDYPPSRFMSATGYGPDKKTAVKQARAELSAMIDVHVKEKFHTIQQSRKENGLSRNLRYVTEDTVAFTENDLIATRAAETRYDEELKIYSALIVLDRSVAAPRYTTQIQSAVERCNQLFENAVRRAGEGSRLVALQDDFEALTHIQKAVKLQLAGMVVCPWKADEFRDMVESPVLANIKDHVRGLLQSIRLTKTSGDNQRARPGYALDEPLVVHAVGGETAEAVKNLPVRFSLKQKGEDGSLGMTLTDSMGRAELHVESTEGSTRTANDVVVGVDLEAMAGEADLSALPRPQVTFTFYLPTRSNTHVAVYVEDETASDAIKEALSSRGFLIVEETSVTDIARRHKLSGEASEEKVREAFAELRGSAGPKGFLFVIAGWVRDGGTDSAKTSYGNLYIARAPYGLRLIDMSAAGDKKTVGVAAGQGKGAYTDDKAEAARRARVDAAEEASAQLVALLSDRLVRD